MTAPSHTRQGVTLNPDHALQIGDRILATYMPTGFWAVKVRQIADGRWVAVAVPRLGTDDKPFLIGCGDRSPEALAVGRNWVASATATVGSDRFRWVGLHDATEETLPGFDPAELFPKAVA